MIQLVPNRTTLRDNARRAPGPPCAAWEVWEPWQQEKKTNNLGKEICGGAGTSENSEPAALNKQTVSYGEPWPVSRLTESIKQHLGCLKDLSSTWVAVFRELV